MNHVLLYANPNPESFSAAVRDRIGHVLNHLDQSVVIRDLYQTDFQPILSAGDFELFFRGVIPDDIQREQEHIATADVLHLIYPLWWTGLPAILKGYVERVFTPGFAYRRQGNQSIPLLTGKRALLWTPHGNTQAEYDQLGMYDALSKTIGGGILEYVGIPVLSHKYFPDIRTSQRETRERWLDEVEDLLQTHFGTPATV